METTENKGLNYWHQFVIDNFHSYPYVKKICQEFKTRNGFLYHKCKGDKIIWYAVPSHNRNHFYLIKLFIDGIPKYMFIKYPFGKDNRIEYLGELDGNDEYTSLYTHRTFSEKDDPIKRYTYYI